MPEGHHVLIEIKQCYDERRLVETPDANLSKGMRYLNGVYTQRFNRKHLRVRHVFQGPYKAILVEKDSYLLELVRYIVLIKSVPACCKVPNNGNGAVIELPLGL